MPNPKDTKKHGHCAVCGKYVPEEEYFHQCPSEEKHFPGCHKVHLECANKKIEEAKNIINRVYISERDLTQIELEWLESLGEK